MLNDVNRNFKRITIEDGLSQGSVSSIIQDSNGYMWIGTDDGLNRYNGNKFEVYKADPNKKNYISGSA
ncbi:MAG: two-component regulator propeller domain-containing protein [Paraclostridium sp.]